MISDKMLREFKKEFYKNNENLIAMNAITKVGIEEASYNNEVLRRHNFEFSDITEKGKITNQKRSGRCWMFSSLNVARVETMKRLNLATFEFSQNYTLFCDKLEKANYFLENIMSTLDEPTDSRIIAHLLTDPVNDGGQWDMFKGILNKYGAVPKSAMPETFHSSNTSYLETVLTRILRAAALKIRKSSKESNKEEIEKIKNGTLFRVYSVLTKCLGNLPEKFTYEYRDKDDKFGRISDITPKDFFKKYVGWNLDDMVAIIDAPTADKEYGLTYTIKYLGSIYEEDKIRYLNAPIEVLKESAIKAIKDGQPVWFGCDVSQMYDREAGIMDLDLYQTKLSVNDVDMSKADRLEYRESILNHAMVFVGVNLDKDGRPLEWLVENSWGKKSGKDGLFSMSDEWFTEFNYEIMVPKKYVVARWLEGLHREPIELMPWDPFGSLA